MNHLQEHEFSSAESPHPWLSLHFVCFHNLWCSVPFLGAFCTSCKVEFAFDISWPCRALVPRWGCHAQSQTLACDRRICCSPTGPCSWVLRRPFLSVVSQVFMQAPNAHSLWACWFLTFLSMSATRWTRTSLRHICTARGSVSVGCSVILPYSGRQRRCWAPWCCMSTVLDWADVPHCSNEPIHRAALAGSSLESFIVLCRYTTSIPQVVFNVAPTCQPLQFHPKMSVERSLRAFGLIHRECPKSLRALCGRVLWAVTRHQCCGKQAINKKMPRREK